jgi:PAS domain-containing protein
MLRNASAIDFESVQRTGCRIVLLDSRCCITGWNDWISRASGIPRQSALGKDLFAVFPSLRATRLPMVIEDSLRVGSSSVLTHTLHKLLPLHRQDGANLLHNIVVRPVSSSGAIHCLLQISDVTVSVTRERVLRDRQNARYHAIVDSAPDAVITTSLDRTIHWVNGATEQIFGYQATELLGQKIDILLERAENMDAAFAGRASRSRRRKSKSLDVASRETWRISRFRLVGGGRMIVSFSQRSGAR